MSDVALVTMMMMMTCRDRGCNVAKSEGRPVEEAKAVYFLISTGRRAAKFSLASISFKKPLHGTINGAMFSQF
jgi:hypothetical protein